MKTSKTLYTSAEVRRAIIDIFSKSKGRRVAVAAFVGDGAEAYLPKPQGIELICWPKAGGTNPNAIKKLMKRGVNVFFADTLHMKVYWTEDQGAVITSANLSTNALGAGDLQEFGILIPSSEIDIDKVIQKIQPREVSPRELQHLEEGHRGYEARSKFMQGDYKNVTFLDWYDFANRQPWKIGYWESSEPFSQAAKKFSNKEYGVKLPYEALGSQRDCYKREDKILSFCLQSTRPTFVKWLSIDFVVKLPKSAKSSNSDYPYEAVQIWSSNKYPPPPFKIEKRFIAALSAALKTMGINKFKEADPYRPSKRLIELIKENY
jgi:hypothetical protein